MKATEPKYSMREAAKRVGVHVATISRLVKDRKLGCYQIGSRRVIGESHLEQFLSQIERAATRKAY